MNKQIQIVTLEQLHCETRIPKAILLHQLQWYLLEGVAITTQAIVDAWKAECEQIRQNYKALMRAELAREGR